MQPYGLEKTNKWRNLKKKKERKISHVFGIVFIISKSSFFIFPILFELDIHDKQPKLKGNIKIIIEENFVT
jgi:uncharacterized protein with PQ loop repeat